MRALVTGGTGFVGSHVAEEFMRRGASVRVLARRSSDTSFLESIGAEIHFGELGGDDSFDAGLYGIDVVIHNAAVVGDWGRWADFERVSTRGTEQLLEAAVRAGVSRFVHMSSASVYGFLRVRNRTIDEEYSLCPRH